MATPTKNLKPFKQTDFFTDDDNRVKEFMNKSGVRDKIYQMSQKYGVTPSEIVYTIYKETGGSFSPQQKGSNSSAVGLFQIMPEKEGANYRDFISYEPWSQDLEGTEQWRMKGGEEWGKFPLVAGEQYSSKNQKGYQKGKRRFYMDDIAKMNELQQLELMDLYLGDKFRGSDHREGNVSKGKAGDVYTAVAWPDAVGASEEDVVIQKGTNAYRDNASWRTNRLFGNITGGSIKDFGGREDDWNKFNNEVLGYTEDYVPTEATSPYPQFKFDDKGKVTFDSTPETKPKPETKPEQNIPTESIIDYSQFELPSFESDKTRVAPFPPAPTTGAVGSWDMFMNSYNESGLPTEGFEEGGKVWKEGDAPIDFGMLPEITLTDRDPHRNKYSNSPMSKVRKNWADNLVPVGYGYDLGGKQGVINTILQTGLGNEDPRYTEYKKVAEDYGEDYNTPRDEAEKGDVAYRERVDLLNMLMGESQKYGSIPLSDYQIEGDPTTYYSSPVAEKEIRDDLKNRGSQLQEEFWKRHKINRSGVLGNYTTTLGEDKKGKYVDYKDVWDLNPAAGTRQDQFPLNILHEQLGAKGVDKLVTGVGEKVLGFTPPKIRGRVYFEKGGQVIKNNDMRYNNYKNGGMHYGVPYYNEGGLFEKLTGKKFKDTGFGKGVRDFGVATLNTAASPIESLMGTDFGIDEKFGYKTKFGDIYGGMGETVGSAIGQLAPAALNLVAPGVGTGISLAAQGIGSGLEDAGITQDISTDPQSAAGANIGSMMSMFAGMNPSGGAGQFTQGMADTGFMQKIAGIFTGGQTPVNKYGGMNYKFAQGGIASPDIEVESGEVINSPGNMRSFTPGAPLNSVGNGAVQVGGNISHEQDGVKVGVEKDAQVYSDKLKPKGSKQTYAQIAKTLNQAIEQAKLDMNSSDPITSGTGKLNVDKYNQKLNKLFADQQNQNKGNTNVVAREGTEYIEGRRQPQRPGVNFLDNAFNPKTFYGVGEVYTRPGIDRPEGISSSMYGLGFDPQSDVNTGGVRKGMHAGPYSNLDRSVSMPEIEGPNYYGHKAYPLGHRFNRNTSLPKAQGGLQYNPNFGGSTGGGFGGMYGAGAQGGSLQNPNMDNIFGSTNFQTSPELQAQMNSFNTIYGGGTSGGGFGNLQGSNPSQYEQVPFESQYSGIKGMLPYASSALNLGLGLKGLKDMDKMMIDPSKYMVDPKIPNININKSAAMAPTMQTLATLMNQTGDIRRKQTYASAFAPGIAERSGSIDFMQGKLDANAASEANKYQALNKGTLYGIDMKNRETAALPYQFLGQAASDITSTSMQMGENKKMEQLLYNMYPEYRNVNS